MRSNWKAIWVHIQFETLRFASLMVWDRVGVFVVCINPGLAVGNGTFIGRCYLKETEIMFRN